MDEVGSSQLAIRQGGGGIHGNPASGHQQQHCHTDPVSGILTKPDTHQGEGREGKNMEI